MSSRSIVNNIPGIDFTRLAPLSTKRSLRRREKRRMGVTAESRGSEQSKKAECCTGTDGATRASSSSAQAREARTTVSDHNEERGRRHSH
eukprot:364928-Chlamydomonas_euryale.AAC.1